MTRGSKVWVAVGGTGVVVGALLILAQPMCACTPALNPMTPPRQIMMALESLAVRQELYYRAQGRYSDSLSQVGVALLFANWSPRVLIANDRGFDLWLRRDSINCTYLVRRVTDDTTVGRRVRCYEGS
jgi:hypothetical protein